MNRPTPASLEAEHYCRVFHEVYGLPTISLRYFTVYGPRMRPDLAVPRFSKRLLAGEPPVIFGDGEQTRDMTFIADIVEANLRLMDTKKDLVGQSINIGSGSRLSVNQLLGVLKELTGARAVLVIAVGRTLATGLGILGVHPAKEMR